jgi:alkylation response protein AidB-like acyl-CoA dehydrogenase
MSAIKLSDTEQDLLNAAIDFAKREVAPHAQTWEDKRHMPVEALKAATKVGLTGLQVPKEYGGLDASFGLKARVAEEMARHCFAFTFSMINNMGAATRIARNAPHEVAEEYLPAMMRGELIGCTALSEPGAGSDFAAIKTIARKIDGGWLLNGEKAWITNAAAADIIHVYAQTDPDQGWRGVAGFMVDAREPGIERKLPFEILGGYAMGVGGFALTDHFVPDNRMLAEPGEGFKKAIESVNAARTYVATMCCGMTEAAIDLTARYALNRPAFGATLSDFQGLRWRLADGQTDVEAARLLAYRASDAIEAGQDAQLHAAHAKKFAARMADSHLPRCIQTMGAAGLLRYYPLARHLACARIANFVDGTSEVQNERIAQALFKAAKAQPGKSPRS